MPKTHGKKRNGPAQSSPYNRPAKSSAANHIFKMKTDIGQHVLKNPGVADAIIAKSGLKQSDVCMESSLHFQQSLMTSRLCLRWDPVLVI